MNQAAVIHEQLIERFIRWAQTQPDIRAAVIVGSRARVDHPVDEWADLDLIVIATDPERYLSTTDWLYNIGNPWLTFLERTATGDETEHRVLFEGGLDVDFVLLPRERVQQVIQEAPVADIIPRGMRVLLDKDGIVAQLTPPPAETPSSCPPAQPEFLEVINDFGYHAVWTVKKLRRGELWTAKGCCDSYMKWLVLRMMEWHARAANGWDYDTWYGGRFLEQWAEPRVLEALRDVFAHYDEEGIWHALLATMDMFRWLATETAEQLGYPYPTVADECVTEWVRTRLAEH